MQNPVYTSLSLSLSLYIYDLKVNSLLVTLFLNELDFICLHTVKWFQELLLNTNNSI